MAHGTNRPILHIIICIIIHIIIIIFLFCTSSVNLIAYFPLKPMGVPYSTKLWREETLAELELLENWRRKLWRLEEEKPIHY